MNSKIRNAPGWLGLNDNRTAFVYLDERAKIVQHIFQLSISGLGGYTIAKLLNEKEVPAFGSSRKWDQSTVHNMLSSRATIGEYQKKEVVDGKELPVGEPVSNYYPAVIDPQTFEAAQQARRQNLLARRGRKGQQITNLFAGIPRCLYCDSRVKLHNAPVKSLVCKNVWKGDGCFQFKWTYQNFEKTFLEILLGADVAAEFKPLLNEMQKASISGETADLYQSRLSIAQYLRSVIVDLKIAFGGPLSKNSVNGLISRDHPDRFFTLVLSDGSFHTCKPPASSKPKSNCNFDAAKISEELGLSQRQSLIAALLAEGETSHLYSRR